MREIVEILRETQVLVRRETNVPDIDNTLLFTVKLLCYYGNKINLRTSSCL